MNRQICVVTGSRAEYGLLRELMRKIAADDQLDLQTVVTGMHLSPTHGLTVGRISDDGFLISARVETVLSSDTTVGVAKSIGLGVIGFADVLERLRPALVVLFGDRYEILAAAQAAMIHQIPIAHIGGGDVGNGTYDNIIRHCITKMSVMHFVTHEDARQRLLQLGEPEETISCVGSTAVDNIVSVPRREREDIERRLGINLKTTVFLATVHPLTMGFHSGEADLEALLEVMNEFVLRGDSTVVFTKANSDNGGHLLNERVRNFCDTHKDCYFFDSLGADVYLGVMQHASVVIGNSSSGIYEAPYLKVPTVDIGPRQNGRAAPASVIRCEGTKESIKDAINRAKTLNWSTVQMMFGDGTASQKIFSEIRRAVIEQELPTKRFIDRWLRR